MVEIKITGETAEKAHNELKDLATLIFGNRVSVPVKEQSVPEKAEPEEEKSVEIEVVPVISSPLPKRTRKSNKTVEEVKPAGADPATEETTPDPVEETKPAEESKPVTETVSKPVEETKPAEEANKTPAYPAPFDDCASETEVVNKVRERVAVVMGNPETEPKAKAIFLEYKVPTVLKLTLEQKMDFFNKIAHL